MKSARSTIVMCLLACLLVIGLFLLLPTQQALEDLPITEVPATAEANPAQPSFGRFGIFLSGDGGWAGLDKHVASKMAALQYPVVGFSTLQYYWKERSVQESTDMIARLMRHYLVAWKRERVDLIGYSFGADLLPFVLTQLPEDLKRRVNSLVMISPGAQAAFEIHVAGWVGQESEGPSVMDALASMPARPVLCLYGKGDEGALCPKISNTRVTTAVIGEGHHLGNEFDAIAERIVNFAPLDGR